MDVNAQRGEGVRLRSRRCFAPRVILSLAAIVTSSLFLAGCGQGVASPTCTTKELVEAAGKGYLKLPPSRDNDTGKARIPDVHPDADIDANQRAALCKVYKSEVHLPG